MSEMRIPTMLSLKEAAGRTGLSYYQLRLLCLDGKVAHIRTGTQKSRILVNLERLIDYLNTEGIENDH